MAQGPNANPGRNDPCPCGSGKKYKRCCLGSPTAAETGELSLFSGTGRDVELESRSLALIGKYPNSGILWKALGQSLQKQGKDARQALHRATKLLPDDAEAHSNLGAALRGFGQLDDAVRAYRRALALNPELAVTHGNLGNALRDLGQIDLAIASYRRALQIEPDLADVHNNLGNVLHDLGRLDEAVTCYRRALQINPGHIDAQSNLGSVLMHLGRVDEAEAFLSRAIELSSGEARPLATALLFIPYRRDDSRFDRLESHYARRESLPPADRIKLDFAMGKAMETSGDYAQAFAAYQEANDLFHQGHPFDEAADDRLLDDSCGEFTREFFEEWAAIARTPPPAPADRVPVFIVGMPRSGTSLIEQMLASHPGIYGAGELSKLSELAQRARPIAPAALHDLGREYLDHAGKLAPQDARFVTDKMPGNYQYLWLVQLMLPNARIIHCVRDPMDTCFSCYTLRFTSGHEYSYDLRMLGRKYLRYRRLMKHWHEVFPPGRILEVSYEHVVASAEREVRRILDYLGLPWSPACLSFYETERPVRTASAAQVRKPIYSSSLARWKHFEKHLGPLLEIIQGGAHDF
jgi:tetratricopeptide (TPR) repeat protein